MTPLFEEKPLTLIEKEIERFKFWACPAVKDAEGYAEAGRTLIQIKDIQKKVAEFFDPEIKMANDLHKSLTGKKKLCLEPLLWAERDLKEARLTYDEAEREKTRKEQERLDAEARKLEEKKKESLEKKAKKAEANGDTDTAEKLREKKEEVYVMPAVALPRLEETDGIQKRTEWKAEVTDLKALVKAIVEGKALLSLIEIRQAEINALAKAYKNTQSIPGIRFFEKTIEVVR